jgi:hypothetical protein
VNLKKILLATVCLVLFGVSNIYPIGAGITGLNFLKISQGARQSGMGEAFTGIADDVNAIFWNPAGLGQLTRHQACLQHSIWMIDINFQYLAYALPLQGIGTIAVYGILLNGGEIVRTTEDAMGNYLVPDENDKAKASDMNFTAAFGKKMSDFFGDSSAFSDLYAGLSVNIMNETIHTDSGGGFSANIAALYRPKYQNYSLGLMVQNAGVSTNRPGLPLAIRAGLGFQFSTENMMNKNPEESYFVFRDNDFAAGIDLVYYPEEAITRVHFKYHNVAARLGYKFISELGLVAGLTFGAGYRLVINKETNVEVDYAYNPYGDLGESHRISMTGKFLGVAETQSYPDKRQAQIYYKEAYELLNNKKYAEAIAKFGECLKRDRDRAEAYMGMGACFLRINKKESAKKVYMIALEKDPNNVKLKTFINTYGWETPQVPQFGQ